MDDATATEFLRSSLSDPSDVGGFSVRLAAPAQAPLIAALAAPLPKDDRDDLLRDGGVLLDVAGAAGNMVVQDVVLVAGRGSAVQAVFSFRVGRYECQVGWAVDPSIDAASERDLLMHVCSRAPRLDPPSRPDPRYLCIEVGRDDARARAVAMAAGLAPLADGTTFISALPMLVLPNAAKPLPERLPPGRGAGLIHMSHYLPRLPEARAVFAEPAEVAGLTLRLAAAQDLPALASHALGPWTKADRAEILRGLVTEGKVVVAVDHDGAARASFVAIVDTPVGALVDLWVDGGHRRQGIGAAVLGRAMEALFEAGCPHVIVPSVKGEAAEALARHMGLGREDAVRRPGKHAMSVSRERHAELDNRAPAMGSP